ncbi:hypothetical protein Q1695_003163 [Nippostrongylus brasiliensis]|nr:hypothetical protein Q1695_003163 [Nippostrongylus brasiliensis]
MKENHRFLTATNRNEPFLNMNSTFVIAFVVIAMLATQTAAQWGYGYPMYGGYGYGYPMYGYGGYGGYGRGGWGGAIRGAMMGAMLGGMMGKK